ncbi:sensor histidine kinase [Caulobacter sp. 602-1]|uniref:sensor histidine kinase n=1 Tax=Caulobacter sp. 602-1 TaxID=2492472 RepID=UPI000F63E10E|nr:ATP-binding protein [Caulobacter sp. 602-1]RRN63517.1 hypothetical protein EIK80_17045 [Caulobacter sp. 602-1]
MKARGSFTTRNASGPGARVAFTSFVDTSTGEVSACEVLQPEGSRLERLAGLGLMSAGIAHDIGNALGGICAGLALLERRLDQNASPEARLLVREILAATERAGAITARIRGHLRAEPATTAAVDLGGLIKTLSPLIGWTAGPRVEVTIRDDARVAHIDCCGLLLERVVINLVVNARQAMPAGGRLDIEIDAPSIPEGGYAVLRVRDSGQGMSPEALRRLFDPAFAPRGAVPGLGLSIVESFVQDLGGRLDVQSTPGQGTTIALVLPTCRAT